MPAAGRILYCNHDNPRPSGGIRTIYSHVRHLVRAGFDAYVVQGTPGFRPAWFDHADVPVLYHGGGGGLQWRQTDTVVMPEDHPGILEAVRAAPVADRVVFCQNHFYAFDGLQQHHSWRDVGVTHVIASSNAIADFVGTEMRWPGKSLHVVPYAVDPDVFFPRPPRRLQVAYMPRKGARDATFARALLSREAGPAGTVPWVALDGKTLSEVAAALGESAIFLSLSYLEGFGLPPVEAMASGCAVVGYHGQGGRDYATPDNGFWSDEADPLSLARTLRRVIDLHLAGDPAVARVAAAGKKTAARYTPERQGEEIVRVMRAIAGEP